MPNILLCTSISSSCTIHVVHVRLSIGLKIIIVFMGRYNAIQISITVTE